MGEKGLRLSAFGYRQNVERIAINVGDVIAVGTPGKYFGARQQLANLIGLQIDKPQPDILSIWRSARTRATVTTDARKQQITAVW